MKIDICIPTYNQARYVAGAVRGALAQVGVEPQVWLSDDASTDETAKVLKAFGGLTNAHCHRHANNSGIAFNAGWVMAQAGSEFIVRLDSDDVLHPDYCVNLAGLLVAHPKAGVAHCAVREIDAEGRGGRQFIPHDWAKANLGDAVFALHDRDPDLHGWKETGLAVVTYSNPQQIAALGMVARIALTTDSFPSHVLQYSDAEVVVLITGTARFRVIAPGFRGQVVDSVTPCHPCPHLERRGFPRCKEGFEVCLNWGSPTYTERIQHLLRGKSDSTKDIMDS